MCFSNINSILSCILVDQLPQCMQPARNIFQCYGLQFGPALQCLKKCSKARLHSLASMGEAIKEARSVEVTEGCDARRVRLGFKIAPFGQLGQGAVDLFNPGRAIWPICFSQYFVWTELKPILPLGSRKHVHDAAINLASLGTKMSEKFCRHSA